MFPREEKSNTNTLLKTRTKLAFQLSHKTQLKFTVKVQSESIIRRKLVLLGIEIMYGLFLKVKIKCQIFKRNKMFLMQETSKTNTKTHC